MTASTLLDDAAAQWFRTAKDGHLLVRSLIPRSNDNNNDIIMARPWYNDDDDVLWV